MGKHTAVKGMTHEGRRWHMMGLRQQGYSPGEVRKIAGMPAHSQEMWLRRAEATGSMQPRDGAGRRTDRADSMRRTKQRLTQLCKAEHKDTVSSKRLAKHVPVGPRQVRRVLHEPGVSGGWHNMVPVPRLSPSTVKKRLAFAKREKDRCWKKVVLSDSKIFVADMTSGVARKMYCWHPAHKRREAPVDKHAAQLHVYSAVCYYGAVLLVKATGTTGMVSKYVYVNGKRKGQPHTGVCAEEYTDIFNEMWPHVNKLYEDRGIHDWCWQQDGAKAHTAKVSMGHVRAMVPEFLKDWPPNSPDLSWIENIWSIVERRLWDGSKQWHNLSTFETALRETWHEVTSEKKLMRKMSCGMRGRCRTLIATGGAKLKY